MNDVINVRKEFEIYKNARNLFCVKGFSNLRQGQWGNGTSTSISHFTLCPVKFLMLREKNWNY